MSSISALGSSGSCEGQQSNLKFHSNYHKVIIQHCQRMTALCGRRLTSHSISLINTVISTPSYSTVDSTPDLPNMCTSPMKSSYILAVKQTLCCIRPPRVGTRYERNSKPTTALNLISTLVHRHKKNTVY